MRNVLNGNLKVWHLFIFGLVFALLGGGAVALADTDAVSALWKAGQVRLAATSSNTYINIDANQEFLVNEVSFDVPSGKKADVQAVWSSFLQPDNSGQYAYCIGKIYLDNNTTNNNLLTPGLYQLFGDGDAANKIVPSGLTVTMNGWRKNISSGAHKIQVYVAGSYGGGTVADRSLILNVNIR